MISGVNKRQLEDLSGPSEGDSEVQAGKPVLLVLWRRRWTVVLTVAIALLGAALYLLKATPVYTSSSNVYIEQQGVKILSETQGFVAKSDSFLYTQAEVIKSAPILTAAINKVNYRQLRTFKDVDNVVAHLQAGQDLRVEVGKKDDVITVSLDSPYPQEAADIVNSVVNEYVSYQNRQKRKTAAEMMRILQEEKKERDTELKANVAAMLAFKEANGALSFQDDKGTNIIVERLAALSTSVTTAEGLASDAKHKLEVYEGAMKDPAGVHSLVQSLQTKESNSSDKELDDLRTRRSQQLSLKAGWNQLYGQSFQRAGVIDAEIDRIEQEIAAKERQIADASIRDLRRESALAESKLTDLRQACDDQKKEAFKLHALNVELTKLQGDAERTQKQCDMLDSRIKEVNVNSEDAGALNIQILQVARAEDKPTKPRKSLTLAAVLLAGLLLGSGFALLRDWLDQRLRSPEDASAATGLAALGIVPHMRGRLSQVMRGQVVQRDRMSDVAEAYRTIRTGIFFGAATDTKTILVTSAAPGEGKSTTASNLAIATAQAGHRTLLLDADFRKPVQHNTFEVDGSTGTADLIAGTVKLRDIIRRTAIDHLFVLPVGTLPSNPSEILAGKRFSQLMSALVAGFDRVIIDTPPVMSVTDARILAASADVSIMVVRTNKSTRKLCSMAADGLRNVGANLIGVIVNDLARNAKSYGYYGYSGYSYYGRNGADKVSPAATNGSAVNGSSNGHTNGHTNGHANGHTNGNGANGYQQPALPQEAITFES